MHLVLELMLVIICCSLGAAQVSQDLLNAIRYVESASSGGVCAVGDGGRSLGSFQIMNAYYHDAVEFNVNLRTGRSYKDVWGQGSVPYAENIVRSYLNRYATERLIRRPPTERDMALIHQGGPNGWNRTTEKAEDYWAKVGNRLNQGAPAPSTDDPNAGRCDPPCESGQCCKMDDRQRYRCFCLEEDESNNLRERPCEDCPIAGIDLVFVLDSSGSIGSSNFQLIRDFVTSIVNALEIGPNQSQVGIIQFSSSARRLFGLTTYNTKASLLQAIRNIIYSGGGTNTASALSLLSGQGFTGTRSDSQGIPRVAIVVTDGNSNSRAATTQAAQTLHATQSSVTVYAVGIGDVDRTELNIIASGSQFVSLIGGFNIQQLQELQEQLREETCKSSAQVDIQNGIQRRLQEGRKAFFRYQVPLEGFTLSIDIEEGSVSVCGSSTIRNPDCSYRPLYDWKRDVTQREEIYISGQVADSQSRRKRAVNTSMEVEYTNFTVYVTVEGLDTNNTFFLNTTFGDTRVITTTYDIPTASTVSLELIIGASAGGTLFFLVVVSMGVCVVCIEIAKGRRRKTIV